MSKNYVGVEDLLCDDTFLSWYFKTDPRAMEQWEKWMADNPASHGRIEQAIGFLSSLHIEEEGLQPDQITYAERILLEKIRKAAPAPVARFYRRRWWMAAASILVLAAGVTGAYRWLKSPSELHAAYGEIRTNKLPDGTEVVVNAGSKIVYSAGWKEGKDREVWLTGEAFFHVAKTPLHSRFIVHTDHFDIIVTGTQFNVVSRPGKANVMLKEGSVILHTVEGQEYKMVPGDFVEYHSAQLEKRPVRNDSVLAWKDRKLVFDNTSIHDLVKIIEEHYGISVQVADDSVGNMTISGILPNDNLNVLLQSLEATSEFEVVRDREVITIRRKVQAPLSH